jgi:phosphoglycerate dehydrogenase-like enzyme
VRPLTVLVIAHPNDRELAALERLPDDTRIVAGDSVEALEAAAPDADAVLCWWGGREVLEQLWPKARRVRWVHSSSAGVENVLFPALVESLVPLTNARGVYSESLGEFVIAAMLHFAKDLRRMVRSQAAGLWDPFDVEMISGKRLGIVGYGDIGRAIAGRARALGMDVWALRRRPELCREDPLVSRAFGFEARKELLAASDYIAAAAPLTSATRGLIGVEEIAAMKQSAVLINVGRGPVVDEAALIAALEQKRIRGAALDVFDREPLEAGHPFYRLENVLLSPHTADHTAGWQAASMEFFIENFERFRRGEPLRSLVDKRAGY